MGTLKTYIFCALGLKVEYLMKGKIELQALSSKMVKVIKLDLIAGK